MPKEKRETKKGTLRVAKLRVSHGESRGVSREGTALSASAKAMIATVIQKVGPIDGGAMGEGEIEMATTDT